MEGGWLWGNGARIRGELGEEGWVVREVNVHGMKVAQGMQLLMLTLEWRQHKERETGKVGGGRGNRKGGVGGSEGKLARKSGWEKKWYACSR